MQRHSQGGKGRKGGQGGGAGRGRGAKRKGKGGGRSPNCHQHHPCKKFKSGEILERKRETSIGTFLHHNQYFYMCMCITLLQKSDIC